MARLTVRIDLKDGTSIGPGKIALLEAIGEEGSIAAAARRLGMSYRRAWLLIDALNASFGKPAVSRQAGGRAGGGATLTDHGRALIDQYRRIVETAQNAAREDLSDLDEKSAETAAAAEPRRRISRRLD